MYAQAAVSVEEMERRAKAWLADPKNQAAIIEGQHQAQKVAKQMREAARPTWEQMHRQFTI